MTRTAALRSFFERFGLPVYEADRVDTDAVYPYLTFENVVGAYGEGDVSTTVKLWYRTKSNVAINAKVDEIYEAVGYDGKIIRFDNGYIWIKRGSPFAYTVPVEKDDTVNNRTINLSFEFFH